MAGNSRTGSRTSTTKETQAAPKAKKLDLDNVNLDERVTVRSLAGWNVSFNMTQDKGSVSFPPNGIQRIPRSEIVAQVNNGLKLFCGNDGDGSHPTLYIDDELTRRYVGFDTEDEKQIVVTDALIKEIYNSSFDDFKTKLSYYITTRAEKLALVETIKRLGLDSYSKNQYAVEYSGFPM
jgi:hypothetical protein